MTTPVAQPAHFFDRLAAKEHGAAGIARVYAFRDDVTGRYFLADTAFMDGATPAYFHDRDDYAGQVSLDSDGEGARTATLFGDDVVLL